MMEASLYGAMANIKTHIVFGPSVVATSKQRQGQQMALGLSDLISFVVGILVGAGGKYYADKYTDKRRSKEVDAHSRKLFREIASTMLDLIREMQKDLRNPDYSFLREFIILPNKRVMFMSGGKKYIAYYEDEHQDLMHKIKLLENNGFIYDATETRTPKYRMTEEFVDYILRLKIKRGKIKI
jgi:hypothetical protein